MNTDPPGTDDESIDVFVLCGTSSDATLLGQKLVPHGYRVTFFNDRDQLEDTIRMGKPNLLICDATSHDTDGYELCRELKADEDLWQIPVLLITGVSNLADLLKVLDSNADNFITQPFDLSYLLPLIEGMIADRVERPDPDKLKTKFKILHDDHEYVIMADRRKLLEFLLSSYELAVNRAHALLYKEREYEHLTQDLERQVKSRTQALADDVERLEGTVKEQARTIAQNTKEIREQAVLEKNLRTQVQEYETAISRHTASLTEVRSELDQVKVRYAAAEEKISVLVQEKDGIEQLLTRDLDGLRTERDGISTELDTTKRELQEALSQIQSHEGRHADLTREKEKSESAVHSYTVEIAGLQRAYKELQERAALAEKNLQDLTAAKTESEERFQQKLAALTGELQQRDADLSEQSATLDTNAQQLSAYKEQVRSRLQEMEKREATLNAEKEGLKDQRDALQEKIDTTTAALGAEREKNAALAKEYETVTSAHEQLGEKLHTVIRQVAIAETALEEEKQLRFASEKNAKEALQAKDIAVQSHEALLANLNDDVKSYADKLARACSERDNAIATIRKLEDDLNAVVLEMAEKEQAVITLTRDMDELRAFLATEQQEHREVDERLEAETELRLVAEKTASEALSAKNAAIQEHESHVANLNADVKDYTDKLVLALQEQDSATATIRKLEDDLNAVVLEMAEKEQAVITLTRDMDELRAFLATEQQEHREVDERLEAETELRLVAEKTASEALSAKNAAIQEHESHVANLNADVKDYTDKLVLALQEQDSATATIRKLEDDLNAVVLEMAEKEQAVITLTRDMDELRAFLATEQQEHREVDERLEAETELRLVAEKNATEAVLAKDAAAQVHEALLANLNAEIKACVDKLALAYEERDSATATIRKLEEDLHAAGLDKAEKEESVVTLTRDIDGLRVHLATEQQERERLQEKLERETELRLIAEKNATEALTTKDAATQAHEALLVNLNAEITAYKDKLALACQERDSATAAIHTLEEDLNAVVLDQSEKKQAVITLTRDMDELRALLATTQQERTETAERLEVERAEKMVLEERLRLLADETMEKTDHLVSSAQQLSETLEQEVALRESIEQKLEKTTEETSAQKEAFQALTRDFTGLQTGYNEAQDKLRAMGDLLETEKQAKVLIEQRLHTITEEKAHEHDSLVTKLQALTTALEEGVALQKSLGYQLKTAEDARKQRDVECAALKKELDQVHAVFDMKANELLEAHEQLAEVRAALQRQKTQVAPTTPPGAGDAGLAHVPGVKDRAPPRVIEPERSTPPRTDHDLVPHHPVLVQKRPATSPVNAPAENPPTVIRNLEDLFEDDPDMDISELPDATIEPALLTGMPKTDTGHGPVTVRDAGEPETQTKAQGTTSEEPDTSPGAEAPETPTTTEPTPAIPAPGTGDGSELGDEDIPPDSNDITETEPEVNVTEIGTLDEYGISTAQGTAPFNRRQWFDLVKWAHSEPSLSRDDKLRIVRLGRLIQTGRRLRPKQEEQVAELVSLAYSLGYKPR